MGVLDSYFDTNTYASPQSDLIDRLLGTAIAIQPSAGFPSSPMNAQASVPAAAPQPQNASPIAVGNYSMPRIGRQSDFELPPGQLDPNTGEHVLPAPPLAAPAPTGDFGSHLATGYQNFRHGGGVISSIVAAITGQRNDPQAELQQQHQQVLQQQFAALTGAGMPAPAAKAAVLAGLDSAVAKQLVGQHLGDDKFAFSTLPDGTVVRQNSKTGEVVPAYQGNAKPTFGVIGEADGVKQYGWFDPTKRTVQPYQIPGSNGGGGTITGPNGQPIAIPAGVDRKTFVNEVTKAGADAAVGKMTEAQAKASAFAARMEQAEASLKALESEGTSYKGSALDNVPLIGGTALTNSLQSNGYQKYRQAAGNFVTAMLRQESGAAISPSEFDRYAKEMLPQPGDGADVLAQKRAARAAAIEQMRRAAGPGYKSSASADATSTPDPLGIR